MAALVPLWVAVTVFAHVFAAFWFVRSARLLRRGSAASLLREWFVGLLCKRHDARDRAQDTAGAHAAHAQEQEQHEEEVVRRATLISQLGRKPTADTGDTSVVVVKQADVVLAWKDVGCSYQSAGGGQKVVLQGAMGCVAKGQLAGLLGPSGGGKSTLLEILAGRKTLGNLSGHIAMRNKVLAYNSGKQHSAACQDSMDVAKADNAAETAAYLKAAVSTAAGVHGTKTYNNVCINKPVTYSSEIARPGLQNPNIDTPAETYLHAQQIVTDDSSKGGSCVSGSTNRSNHNSKLILREKVLHTAIGGGVVWRSVRDHARAVKNICAFVAQEEAFHASLTAKEELSVHAALLGLGHNTPGTPQLKDGSGTALDSAVACALQGIGLTTQADTLVGGSLPGGLTLRGLSGGERRRLSVAAGLLGNPHLLLLDEPTTGLDANAATALMSRLSSLCDTAGITVLCSLHQPRAAIWNLLDVVIIVSEGYTIYSGLHDCLAPWLSDQLGYQYDPVRHGSLADFVMDLVNISFKKTQDGDSHTTMTSEKQLQGAADAFKQTWDTSHKQLLEGLQGTDKLNNGHVAANPVWAATIIEDRDVSQKAAGWFQQVWILFKREAALQSRNPADLAGRAAVFCWAALIVGLVFYGLQTNISGMMSRVIVCYVEVAILILLPYVYMSLYTSDRRTNLSEMVSGLYHPSAFYTAKALLLTAFSAINALIFAAVVYGMSGPSTGAGSLFSHLLVATLTYWVAQQVLFCAATIAPNQDVAFMMSIVWTAINILLANYPIRVQEYTMSWIAPLRYISAMYHAFSGLLAVTFNHAPPFTCSGGLDNRAVLLLPEYLPNTAALKIPYVQNLLLTPGQGCELPADAVLQYFGVAWPWWGYVVGLTVYLIVMHGISLLALLWASRRERR